MKSVAGFVFRRRATVALVACVLLSLGGIVIVNCPADAGRGGALAVALSLAILFCAETPGARTFRLLTTTSMRMEELGKEMDEAPEAPTPTSAKTKQALQALDVRLQSQEKWLKEACDAFVGCQEQNEAALRQNNIQMALGSAIGTLAWGFGDIAFRMAFIVPAACA